MTVLIVQFKSLKVTINSNKVTELQTQNISPHDFVLRTGLKIEIL